MNALFIDPGALRHELSLQELREEEGGDAFSWIERARVFAMIEPADARSNFGAGRWLESASHRITLRHRGDVASGMRFDKAGRLFTILTVTDPDESRRYLVCRVKELKS